MAFTLDPQTEKITFGVVADGTHDAIALDLASKFNVSEDFNDDFSVDNFTNISGTKVSVDTINQEIDWNATGNFLFNEGEFVDPISSAISTSSWVLRFKLIVDLSSIGSDGTANSLFVGFSDDNSSLAGTAQDFAGLQIFRNGVSSTGSFRLMSTDEAVPNVTVGTDTTLIPTVGVYYVELIRDGSNITANVYSDSTYSSLLESVTQAIGTASGLRYLKVMVSNRDGTGDHTFEGKVDSIQFWDGVTEPVITSNSWRVRFTLDITSTTEVSSSDVIMWIGLYDENEISDSNNAQDGFQLATVVNNVGNTFEVSTPDAESPRSATIDRTMATIPTSGTTYFVEMIRDSDSQTTVRFYTDGTFSTISETKTQAGISGTDNIKYLKLMNDVLASNGNEIDGTFDNLVFTDLSDVGEKTKVFTIDALLLETQDFNFTVDSLVQNEFDKIFTIDVILLAEQEKTFTADAIIPEKQDKTFDIDVLLQLTQDETFIVDGLTLATQTTTTDIDAIVFIVQTEEFDNDALILATQDFNFTVDSLIQQQATELFILDAFLQATFDEEFDTDAILQATFDANFTTDAKVVREIKFIIDASVAPPFDPFRDVGDLIIRVLVENPPSLTGIEIVDKIRDITEVELQWNFFGKTSRIKNWIGFLDNEGVIQDDDSSPDWWRTNWSLV